MERKSAPRASRGRDGKKPEADLLRQRGPCCIPPGDIERAALLWTPSERGKVEEAVRAVGREGGKAIGSPSSFGRDSKDVAEKTSVGSAVVLQHREKVDAADERELGKLVAKGGEGGGEGEEIVEISCLLIWAATGRTRG